MTCIWSKLAKSSDEKPPRDVPRGHIAVTVGEARKRFVIRADYLNNKAFRQLLNQEYYEDYGHQNADGPLFIPCDEFLFRDIIHSLKVQPIHIIFNKRLSMRRGSRQPSPSFGAGA